MKYTEKQIETLLSLPQHLQTTYKALLSLGQASASQTAQITGRARAVESAYLNQLVNMKILSKNSAKTTRRGKHTVIFQDRINGG